MFKALALALLLLGPSAALAETQIGGPNLIVCNQTKTFTGSGAAAVLVAATTNRLTSICGWHVTSNSGTVANFVISTGTQTTNPCDTGTVNLTGTINVTSAAPASDHLTTAFVQGAVSGQICINAGAALTGQIYYVQTDVPH